MIDKMVTDLAEKREIVAIAQDELQRLEQHVTRIFGDRLEQLSQVVKRAKEEAFFAEDSLKYTILDLYHGGKVEKKPHGALQIKQWTVLSYDQEKAFAYCVAHLPGALSMKKTAFEKVAKVA